jgi:hypothetical protein
MSPTNTSGFTASGANANDCCPSASASTSCLSQAASCNQPCSRAEKEQMRKRRFDRKRCRKAEPGALRINLSEQVASVEIRHDGHVGQSVDVGFRQQVITCNRLEQPYFGRAREMTDRLYERWIQRQAFTACGVNEIRKTPTASPARWH